MDSPRLESFIGRASFAGSLWDGRRKAVVIPSLLPIITVILLFVADLSYLSGATFRQSDRVHALKVLAVDYDGGAVGQAVIAAYQALQSNEFPTIDFGSASKYPDPLQLQRAVCKGDYWAAVSVNENASLRLQAALSSDSATTYDPTGAITYTYNQARYPALADGSILSNLRILVATSRSTYYKTPDGEAALASLNTTNAIATAAYLNPIDASSSIIAPTTQGTRVFYNTVGMVMPMLGPFFIIMALNGVAAQSGLFKHARIWDVWRFRFVIGKTFSCLFAIALTGYTWAFRENWGVTGTQFAETWLLMWLFVEVNWMVFESLIGSFLPMMFAPFFVLTWVLTNVASTIAPFELSAGWYRVGYALPAHEAYSLLVQIWSHCADQTKIAIPVLLAYWVLGHITAAISIRKRCIDAERVEVSIGATEKTEGSVPSTATQQSNV